MPAPIRRPEGGPARAEVHLAYSPAGGARFRNLRRCGSVWACPECAAIIARGRIEELRALLVHAQAEGWGACWQTLTLPHDAPDRLADRITADGEVIPGTLELVAEGWRRIRQGRGWRALEARYGIVGASGRPRIHTVRKVEVTHGANGWHPHLHITYLTRRPLEEAELVELELYVWGAWRALVLEAGFRAPHQDLCPIAFLSLESSAWADYLGKMLGLEFAGQEKHARAHGGKTPFELLEDACALVTPAGKLPPAIPENRAVLEPVALWREYERASRGRRQLSWSHGLKAMARIAERTDEQQLELGEQLLAEAEEVVYSLTPSEWRAAWAHGGRLEMLCRIAARPAPLEERRAEVAYWLGSWVSGAPPSPWSELG